MALGSQSTRDLAILEAQYRWQAARALLGDGPNAMALPWPTEVPRATALESDQVLFSMVVMPDRTALLVYLPDRVLPLVFTLPVGAAQWRERVRRWRTLLAAPDAQATAHAAQMQGHALYRALFGTLPAAVLSKPRWVIVPDADLHDLPWAALVVDDAAQPTYLVERASVAIAASVDAFNLLSQRPSTGRRAVGAGDAVAQPRPSDDTVQRQSSELALAAALGRRSASPSVASASCHHEASASRARCSQDCWVAARARSKSEPAAMRGCRSRINQPVLASSTPQRVPYTLRAPTDCSACTSPCRPSPPNACPNALSQAERATSEPGNDHCDITSAAVT